MTDDTKAADRERIKQAANEIVDGIFFDLPAEIYHQVDRLSTSYLQAIDISPADFWAGSWLNPANDGAELDEDSTNAQRLGKAYHTARLEPHLFEAAYCREISRDDFKEFGPDEAAPCWTGTDIEKALAEIGEPKSKAGEFVLDKGWRLSAMRQAQNLPTGLIYPLAVEAFEKGRGQRIAIKGKYFDDIVTDMHRIRGNPEIAALLSGGEAEVSIFWTDAHGLKMKTRLDYLRPDGWLDLKTISNSNGKRFSQLLRDAMMYNRLYMQAAVHRDAIEAVARGALPIAGSPEQEKLIDAVIDEFDRNSDFPMHFVFIQKDGVPNQIAMRFPFFDVPANIERQDAGATDEQIAAVHAATRTTTGLYNVGRRAVTAAKEAFVLYSQVYPIGQPWFPLQSVSAYDDADFPPRFLEEN